MKTCILAALKKNHVGSGKVLAMAMTNAWAVFGVVNPIVISHPILHIIVIFKNLTAAIQVNMSIEKRYSAVLIHIYNYFSA